MKMALRRVGAAGKGKQKELTEEQKQEIKEAFDLFDTDGSVPLFRKTGTERLSADTQYKSAARLCIHDINDLNLRDQSMPKS